MAFRYAGDYPVPDGEGGIVRPGEIRDKAPEGFGPWEVTDEPEAAPEPAASPAPPESTASSKQAASDDSASDTE